MIRKPINHKGTAVTPTCLCMVKSIRSLPVQRKMAVAGFTVLTLACLSLAQGCAKKVPANYQSDAQWTFAPSSQRADTLWTIIEDILRDHHYTLDRVDRRGGVITTKPTVSQHFFEIWRHDVNTWRDFHEASLNPMRRWIEVHASPYAAANSETTIDVRVYKQRLSAPDRQFNNSGAAYQFFGDQLPSTTGKPRVTDADHRWLDKGRDYAMEDYLRELIEERFQKSTRESPRQGI